MCLLLYHFQTVYKMKTYRIRAMPKSNIEDALIDKTPVGKDIFLIYTRVRFIPILHQCS